MGSGNYRELIVWQRAMDLAAAVHRCTRRFPADERFGLTSQIRRAAVSVPSNIAEGQGRGTAAEFRQFLRISRGSLQEVETQLLLAERFEYVTPFEVQPVLNTADEVARLLHRLQASLAPSSS